MRKTIKKMMALALAMVMMLAMGATAFAADPESGSITVNPNYKDQTYTLYKLFDAHITFDDNGKVRAITYTVPGKGTDATDTDLGDGTAWFHINENGFVEANDGVGEDWAKDADAIAWAESFGTAAGDGIKAASDNDANVKWTGLDWGYYFVKTTLGAFIGIDSTQPNATIQDKNEKPSIDKEITAVTSNNEGTSNFGTGDDGDKTNGANEKATAQVGDKISYKLTVEVKPGAKNYVITDTLTNLKLDATSLKVDGTLYSSSDKVDTSSSAADGTFTIKLLQTWLDAQETATTVTITYDAVLQSSAVIGAEGNPNDVTLTWGDNPTDNKDEDEANVYSAQLNLLKTDNNSAALAGAKFVLKNKSGKYYKLDNGAVTWVDSAANADFRVTNAEGKFDSPFSGLGNGEYWFQETETPAGFNKIADTDTSLKVTISDSDYTDDNLKQDQATTVINEKGTLLPSTGGIGTTIFYVIGAILVIGAGIVLVSRRRMKAN